MDYMDKKFAAAINCIDGRAQDPVTEYMRKTFSVDYIDMITEPGPNKILSEAKDTDIIDSLKKKVAISVGKHNSQIIAIVGHYDCAGNPKNEAAQKEDLRKSINTITSWGFPVKKIIALWLDEKFEPSIIS